MGLRWGYWPQTNRSKMSSLIASRPVGMGLVMNNRGRAIRDVRAAIACVAAVAAGGRAAALSSRGGRCRCSTTRSGWEICPRPTVPAGPARTRPLPTGTVVNTNNGPIDKLALLSVNDIEEYWKAVYSESLKGTFRPVDKLISYDSDDPNSPIVCHAKTYKFVNAFFNSSVQPDRLGSRGVLAARATLFRRYVGHRGVGPRVRPRAAEDGETGVHEQTPPSSSSSKPIASQASTCIGWPPASRRASH